MPHAERAALALALATAACGTATSPDRQKAYEFADPSTQLVFHWVPTELPVRYWVAPDAGPVRDFVETGVTAWSNQFLYGEFRGILVEDSTDADVIVRITPATPPAGSPTDAPPVVGACRGVTTYDLEPGEDRLAGPFHVTVDWDVRFADLDVVNCLERVTIHEIGHTLGIFSHSSNALDLMFTAPQVRTPSDDDRQTVDILYHTSRTIRSYR
jgi:predicted Zn-dependent protease